MQTSVVSSCNLYIYDYVILCHCTLAAALYFEQSSCDEIMEFKQIQTRAQPEESLKRNHSCTNLSPRTWPLLLVHSSDRFVQLWLCFNDSSCCRHMGTDADVWARTQTYMHERTRMGTDADVHA